MSPFKALFAGAIVLVVVGVLDDHRDLSARSRFVAQIGAGLLMALWGGVLLADLGYLLSNQLWVLGLLAIPVTVFATVGVINATNMIDGLDGLAASLVLVTIGALMLVAWHGAATTELGILTVLAGVTLGFLVFNLRRRGPALVFMGDAGSMFLGFVLVWFLVAFTQGSDRLMAPTTALWLFALPLIDTFQVIIKRAAQGRSPFSADRAHCHHVLQDAGLSRRQTLAAMVGLALAAAAAGLAGHWLAVPEPWMLGGFLTFTAMIAVGLRHAPRLIPSRPRAFDLD